MRFFLITFLSLVALGVGGCSGAVGGEVTVLRPEVGEDLVDDIAAVRARLEEDRSRLRRDQQGPPASRARQMIRLGMWEEAESLIQQEQATSPDLRVAEAELRMRQHAYGDARTAVDALLGEYPENRRARLLSAQLAIQAWRLEEAAEIVDLLLHEDPDDEEAALLVGRIHLLEKRYDEALSWAHRVQERNAENAAAYLLEADVHFWNQNPAAAEQPLIRSLALDPYNPDARFSYGYAIWRRVDATQLDDMAAQWNLALEIDPLHYVTHWHWGNGHTNLTYADYRADSDAAVRDRLAPADSLIAAGDVSGAVELATYVEEDYPDSVLPGMLRGSAYYMAWDMDRAARLDAAQSEFEAILARKPNYGPAHNGLAAVIKQRQIGQLASFDSLNAVIADTELPSDSLFEFVFPDIDYYPGDRIARMVRLELGPSLAYLPMIARQQRQYRIPPLHQDLAAVMDRPSLRTSTTFDNRQWMDIRGVGSGAAAIEYVERGAYQERKVLLHEFVHLFHGNVLTDAERRRIRQLYIDAMEQGRTLDYYASNNESEFLAQAYPAYLSPVKVHPLNHKAMNTRSDLEARDPATFAFVDSLIARQRAALDGDTQALASNWSQVYVNLSAAARRDTTVTSEEARLDNAAALLDTALVHDTNYLPAHLSYAAVMRSAERFAEAGEWLDRAERIDPGYAPLYRERAQLLAAERAGRDDERLLNREVALYRQALALEDDVSERAELNRALRDLLYANARYPEAVRIAEEYAESAPTISTYLRDRRDEAAAFAAQLRAEIGHADAPLEFYRRLVAQKPQNWRLVGQMADALMQNGEYAEAEQLLASAQLIRAAGGTPDRGFDLRLAESRLLQGDPSGASGLLEGVRLPAEIPAAAASDALRKARLLAQLDRLTEAAQLLERVPRPVNSRDRAEVAFTEGVLRQLAGDSAGAEGRLQAALHANPYHLPARAMLVRSLRAADRQDDADALVAEAATLELPLGPTFHHRVHEQSPAVTAG